MDEQTIRQRISTQRDFFATGATLPLSFRLKQLEQLKLALKRHEQDLYTALKADLGKSRMESYMCEIGLTLSELTWMQKHLPKDVYKRQIFFPDTRLSRGCRDR